MQHELRITGPEVQLWRKKASLEAYPPKDPKDPNNQDNLMKLSWAEKTLVISCGNRKMLELIQRSYQTSGIDQPRWTTSLTEVTSLTTSIPVANLRGEPKANPNITRIMRPSSDEADGPSLA